MKIIELQHEVNKMARESFDEGVNYASKSQGFWVPLILYRVWQNLRWLSGGYGERV